MNYKYEKLQSLIEVIKYALVGTSNVLIDMTVLNILSYATGITSGKMLIVFSITSFFVYSTSGYHLNNKFTFKKTSSEKSYVQYALVLFICMILNSVMLVLLTNKNPLISLLPSHTDVIALNHLWMNISILIDSTVIGSFGFLINKFFVFNKKKTC